MSMNYSTHLSFSTLASSAWISAKLFTLPPLWADTVAQFTVLAARLALRYNSQNMLG